jgi:hypothetical protein
MISQIFRLLNLPVIVALLLFPGSGATAGRLPDDVRQLDISPSAVQYTQLGNRSVAGGN